MTDPFRAEQVSALARVEALETENEELHHQLEVEQHRADDREQSAEVDRLEHQVAVLEAEVKKLNGDGPQLSLENKQNRNLIIMGFALPFMFLVVVIFAVYSKGR